MNLLRSVSLLALASLSLAASAQTIETYSANPAYGINPFGNDDTATYGQTFVAANSRLTSYASSFTYQGGSPFTFQLYVAAWDAANQRVAGPILFSSGLLTSTASTSPTAYAVNANVGLTTGQTYVAFFSTSAQAARPLGSMFQGYVGGSAYAGGDFVFLNSGADASQWSTANWSSFGPGAYDSAFRAEFASAVPGPVAALPFALMALKRRKRA